ncbi:hypothetical protein [Clostridium sp. Marseille-QA1073]
MNKTLKINSSNCFLSVNCGNNIRINGADLNKIIHNNLPELEDYTDYPIKLSVQIELLGTDELKVNAEGYEIIEKKEDEELW